MSTQVTVSTLAFPTTETEKCSLRALHLRAELPEDLPLEEIREDDRTVAGLYQVLVPTNLSDKHAANCALDGFHSKVPIKDLWRFEFTVLDPSSGEVLERDEELDGYELAECCGGVFTIDPTTGEIKPYESPWVQFMAEVRALAQKTYGKD